MLPLFRIRPVIPSAHWLPEVSKHQIITMECFFSLDASRKAEVYRNSGKGGIPCHIEKVSPSSAINRKPVELIGRPYDHVTETDADENESLMQCNFPPF